MHRMRLLVSYLVNLDLSTFEVATVQARVVRDHSAIPKFASSIAPWRHARGLGLGSYPSQVLGHGVVRTSRALGSRGLYGGRGRRK